MEWGVLALYGPDTFIISVGAPERDAPHLAAGVGTVYVEPYRDLANKDCTYLPNRGLVAGAAQLVLAFVINF